MVMVERAATAAKGVVVVDMVALAARGTGLSVTEQAA